MKDPPPPGRLAALIARAEKRLNASHELGKTIDETLLGVRHASARSRQLFAPRHDGEPMRTITLPWETWRAVIAILRQKALPYMLEHADYLEQQLERHAPDEPTVRLSLTDDVYLRSSNWARVQLGIPLPED
jgi:hypothetical protein